MPSQAMTAAAGLRIADIRKQMKRAGIDALVVTRAADIRYLTGFSGSSALVVITKKHIDFVTNDLYDVQVKSELHPLHGLRTHIARNFIEAIAQSGIITRGLTIGFVAAHTTVSALKSMKKGWKPAVLIEVDDLCSGVTEAKTPSERASISKAASIASAAYEELLGTVRAGMTEIDVANFLATTTRELGSERDAFDIIVVSGVRSAMPHGRASKQKLKNGSVVTVDFGCCVNGLYSDMTRTFCLGKPKPKVEGVFAVLYDAHHTALDVVKPGLTAGALDAAARTVIEKAGYGGYFRHSLGHGLGYEVHENPRIAKGNPSPLQEHCVITIEPGIYIPGEFGMRIEDDVVVTKNGAQILTTAPRELVVV